MTLTNEELRARAQDYFDRGLPVASAVFEWLHQHRSDLAQDSSGRREWLARNFAADPELAPYLLDRDRLAEIRLEAVMADRRRVYEYLKKQAEELHAHRRMIEPVIAGNNMVRIAGEVLRGLHAKPKVTNSELWR